MKVDKRRSKLVEIVRQNGKISVEDLADKLQMSRETIRRDLTELVKQGKIQKIHGAAVIPKTFGESSFQNRMSLCSEAKLCISEVAADTVAHDETLFINTGSTTVYFAEKLNKNAHLTVITNSFEIARVVTSGQSNTTTYMLGGEYRPGNRQTLGGIVAAQVGSYRAHHCFLSVGAMDVQSGLLEFSQGEAQLAGAMIEQAQKLTVLADSTKFNAMASFKVCDLLKIDHLITNQHPPKDIAECIQQNGGTITVCSVDQNRR